VGTRVRREAQGSLSSIDDRRDSASGGELRAEGEVLEAARGGDRQALELLLVSHYDRVHALCRRMLGNEADALDATQDALLAAVRALDRFDGRSTFSTWIYRIATNACIDELRRRRRRPAPGPTRDIAEYGGPGTRSVAGAGLRPGTDFGDASSGLWRMPPSGDDGPGDISSAVATRLDVDRALAALPAELRAAVVLRDVCDLPYDEIAAVMDVPIGTVRSRIARGRAAVAAILGGGPDEAPRSVDGAAGNRAGTSDVETHVTGPPPRGAAGGTGSPRPTP
jgi:RNA polymerase sigma-70 factor (ECF subfamily)